MSKTNRVLRVVSQREGFRRAGFTFGRAPVDLPIDDLTTEQRSAIEIDPSLVSMEVAVKPDAEAKEDALVDATGAKSVKK
jgi:hypothetical protein